MHKPNEVPRPRYPVDYSQLTPRGVKRTLPPWNTPDLNRGFADDSDESNMRGVVDWNSAPPLNYIP